MNNFKRGDIVHFRMHSSMIRYVLDVDTNNQLRIVELDSSLDLVFTGDASQYLLVTNILREDD